VTRRRWPITSKTSRGVSLGIGVKTSKKGVCRRRIGKACIIGFPYCRRVQGARAAERLWRQLA
jgi:hypothetical protein